MTDQQNNGFKCENCDKRVPINDFIGTKNRNHCPFCLHSKHVDDQVAGDRQATCKGLMEPIGLTFKRVKQDKYGQDKFGELMLVHACSKCGKLSINRIAADDNNDKILELLDSKTLSSKQAEKIKQSEIKMLKAADLDQVKVLLFGKK